MLQTPEAFAGSSGSLIATTPDPPAAPALLVIQPAGPGVKTLPPPPLPPVLAPPPVQASAAI